MFTLSFSLCSEQPLFTSRAHVFQIDPVSKKSWLPASKQAVAVSFFFDNTRNSFRIISVDGSKVKDNNLNYLSYKCTVLVLTVLEGKLVCFDVNKLLLK